MNICSFYEKQVFIFKEFLFIFPSKRAESAKYILYRIYIMLINREIYGGVHTLKKQSDFAIERINKSLLALAMLRFKWTISCLGV